jgi:hypothetical protein
MAFEAGLGPLAAAAAAILAVKEAFEGETRAAEESAKVDNKAWEAIQSHNMHKMAQQRMEFNEELLRGATWWESLTEGRLSVLMSARFGDLANKEGQGGEERLEHLKSQITALDAAMNALRGGNAIGLPGEMHMPMQQSVGHAAIGGMAAGVFAAEHGQNRQIQLLQAIEQHTNMMSNQKSRFNLFGQ